MASFQSALQAHLFHSEPLQWGIAGAEIMVLSKI